MKYKSYRVPRELKDKLCLSLEKRHVVEYKTKLYYPVFDRFFRYSRTNEYLYYDGLLIRTGLKVGQGLNKKDLLSWLEKYQKEA